MPGVDGILQVATARGADELRLGTDVAPRMLQRGAPVKLSIPPTDEKMLRHLLGEVLSAEREATLRASGRVAFSHRSDGGEPFSVELALRGDAPQPGEGALAFDAVFRRGAATARGGAGLPPSSALPLLASSPVAPPLGATTPVAPPFAAPPVAAPPLAAPSPARRAEAAADLDEGLAALLARARALRATDVHLAAGEPAFVRIDGRVRALDELPPATVDALLHLLAAPPGVGESLARGVSCDRAFDAPGVGRFRANLYRAGGRLAAALRVLPPAAPSLAELALPVALDDLLELPHGLVLVCGPTGCGKTTTLAALAQTLARRRAGVLITLEDPIEFLLEPGGGIVRQRQIGVDVRDFATGLRDALREDPDVLVIGEMRDADSISLALTAAETGHLVLASLHSRTAASSVERIVDAYPPERQQQVRVQLADALRAVLSQRLVPRAKGPGRLVAVEVLRGTHNVASLIREGKTAQLPSVIQSSGKEGMLPLERCLADLVRSGQVAAAAASSVASDPAALEAYLSRR